MDSVICGEVLLLKNDTLFVCCVLCEKNFAFDEYAEHVKQIHCSNYISEAILEDYGSDVQNLSVDRCSITETCAPLVSEDDFKMLEELEFIAPEPENCREIEDFVLSLTEKERSQNGKYAEMSVPTKPHKQKQKKKQSRRIYKCQRCNFATQYLSSMRCHIQRHDGIRPFNCPKCTKAFYTQTEVDNHMRTHTMERPYLCTTCGHTSITSFALWRHRKSCNNIRDKECTICKAKFADMQSLRDHMATHSDIRQFHCDLCTASFKLKKALLSHVKIHENKREYKCKLCAACFNQAPSLSSHMKTKH